MKKTLNAQIGVPRDVCGYENGERVHVERTRELIDFFQRRAFQASLQ